MGDVDGDEACGNKGCACVRAQASRSSPCWPSCKAAGRRACLLQVTMEELGEGGGADLPRTGGG